MNRFPRLYLALLFLVFTSGALLAESGEVTPSVRGSGEIRQDNSAELDRRLDVLVERLEEKRVEFHIPGMAIAVVKDDEVILARGFGMANLEEGTPVTPETLFAIGSSSKAFTATMIGMLVDEGVMEWDDPVTKFLPYFKLPIDSEKSELEVTIRDLLCHRTGFTRMGPLWAGGTVSREEILRTAVQAEPWAGFRKEFHYNNVMFLAAGVAAGKAAESDWDALIADRIFKPLGMSSSNTSVVESQQDERLALGYDWRAHDKRFKHLPMRVIDTIGPAGAINSNVLDMAKWVRFLLAKGKVEGTQLISAEQFEETRTRQIEIGGGVGYGLGWMLREWKGQQVVEHGGSIDGFAAEVGLLPESNLGFVLLANVTATPLQQISLGMVWESILETEDGKGEEYQVAGRVEIEDFSPFVGEYRANFGPFTDQRFSVLEKGGALAVDVPGQMVFELKPPDEAGKREFAITDTVALSFVRDGAGRVMAMKMYQGGYAFYLPRDDVEIEPEIPLAELNRYLGEYHSEEKGKTMELVIKNNCLAVRIPGRKTHELIAPNEDGRWVYQVVDILSVSFDESEAGEIVAMTYFQEDQSVRFARVVGEGPSALPSVEEIFALALEEDAAFGEWGSFRLTGTFRMVHSGLTGTATMSVQGRERFRMDIDLGRFGSISTVINGERSWADSSFNPFEEFQGVMLEQAKLDHPAALAGDWRSAFDSIRVDQAMEWDGQRVFVLRCVRGELPERRIFVSAETGDVVRVKRAVILPSGKGQLPMVATYGDYRAVNGIRIPFEATSTNDAMGTIEMVFERVEVDPEFADDFFTMKPPAEQ